MNRALDRIRELSEELDLTNWVVEELFHRSPDAILLCAVSDNLDALRILKANASYADLVGIPAEALEGRNPAEFIHPRDLTRLKPAVDRVQKEALKNGTEETDETSYFRNGSPDTGYAWIEWSATKTHEGLTLAIGRPCSEDKVEKLNLKFGEI